MKGNNGDGDTPERDLWQTNQEFWDVLNNQYHFTFDCCASTLNTKCGDFTDNFEIIKNIEGPAWMNPPFSEAKNMFKHFFKVINKGVAIYRCDNMETSVWQEIILQNASWIFIPRGRISYTPFDITIRGGGDTLPFSINRIQCSITKEFGRCNIGG